MTQPLTPERLAEMRARCEAATPGPPQLGTYGDNDPVEKFAENISHGSGPVWIVWAPEHPLTVLGDDPPVCLRCGDEYTVDRDEVGTVCDTCAQDLVQIASTTIERLRSAADRTKDAWDRDVAELHAAREEVERLRARVAEMEAQNVALIADAMTDARVEVLHELDRLANENAALRARPTVHPLAMAHLQAMHTLHVCSADEADDEADQSWTAWHREHCPVFADPTASPCPTCGAVVAQGDHHARLQGLGVGTHRHTRHSQGSR